jgi:hypothetical protein
VETGGDAISGSQSVLYDTVAPTVAFVSPMPNAFVHGVVTVAANPSDPGGPGVASGVTSVALSLDGGAPPATAWNTAGVSDGPHVLQATATDAAGNQTNPPTAITVTVDNTPPDPFMITAQSPVAGKPTLAWPVGPYTYTVRRDGTDLGAVNSIPWTDPINPGAGLHTYVVTATDSALNTRTSTASVLVVAASATQPRSLSAASPTNSFPHLTWQKPSIFAVTKWEISRDGALVGAIDDPDVMSFDDTTVGTQGSHVYTVRAKSDETYGDPSSPIAVTYDTLAPALASLTGTAVPDGSVALTWPDATDPTPGSGISSYVVRRGGQPPGDPTAGTAICTVALPAATGCADETPQSGITYGYSVFALDGAGNATRQTVTVKPIDTVAPDPVTGFHSSVGPTNAHLFWDAPARQGKDADLAGYRIIKLGAGIKQPTNPRDGSEVCPGTGFRDSDCFIANLTTGKKVTFAIYAQDEVPNFSAPTLLTVTPNSSDHTKPGLPKKVRLKRVGTKITMSWVSPKDRDLSHFRVTLLKNGPAKRPALGKVVVTGRVLKTSFKLKAGQIVYVNLFAIDLSGNFSRVTRLIVMPDKIVVPKSKHKKVAKQKAGATAPKNPKKS